MDVHSPWHNASGRQSFVHKNSLLQENIADTFFLVMLTTNIVLSKKTVTAIFLILLTFSKRKHKTNSII